MDYRDESEKLDMEMRRLELEKSKIDVERQKNYDKFQEKANLEESKRDRMRVILSVLETLNKGHYDNRLLYERVETLALLKLEKELKN